LSCASSCLVAGPGRSLAPAGGGFAGAGWGAIVSGVRRATGSAGPRSFPPRTRGGGARRGGDRRGPSVDRQASASARLPVNRGSFSDTTVPEPALGDPNEPGIWKGLAERGERAWRKLHQRGVAGGGEAIEQAKELSRRVKEPPGFATGKA